MIGGGIATEGGAITLWNTIVAQNYVDPTRDESREGSDVFGEFKIDRLKPDSGRHDLVIEADGREAKRLGVDLGKSVYLGRIELAA